MQLLPVLWAHFRYLFLWEGSPEPDCIGVWKRLLQSVLKVGWSPFSVKLPFFSRIWARDRTIFKWFFRIWVEDRFLFLGKWRSRTESSAVYWASRAEMAQLASGTYNSAVWLTFPALATQFLTHRGIVQLEEMPRSEALHLWRKPQRGSSFGVISTRSAGPLVAYRSVGSSQALLCDKTQNVLSQKSELQG